MISKAFGKGKAIGFSRQSGFGDWEGLSVWAIGSGLFQLIALRSTWIPVRSTWIPLHCGSFHFIPLGVPVHVVGNEGSFHFRVFFAAIYFFGAESGR